jgi:starch phosphorylase
VHFGKVKIETHDGWHDFEVEVALAGLKPDELKVELYAMAIEENGPAIEVMTASNPCADSDGYLIYSGKVSAAHPATDYTPRVVPCHANASVPLEAEQILWQR